MNKKEFGDLGEKIAAEFIEGLGHTIVDTKFRCRRGEIDIISRYEDLLVFIEVKNRNRHSEEFDARFSIDKNKQNHIRECARYFLHTHQDYCALQIRFDVITIMDGKIDYIENAFW